MEEKITKRILNLTLEIIYLLTGEDYALVKKSSERTSGGWSITRDHIAVPPFHSQIHDGRNGKKILNLTNKIIGLLTEEDYLKDHHNDMLENWQDPGGDKNPEMIPKYKRLQKPPSIYCGHPPEMRIHADACAEGPHCPKTVKTVSSPNLPEDCMEENENTAWDCKVENRQTGKGSNIGRMEIKQGKQLLRVKIEEEETPTPITPDAEMKENNSGCSPPGDNLLTRGPRYDDMDILEKLNTEKHEDHLHDESEEEDWLLVKIKEENVPTEITSEQFDQYLQELQESKRTSRRISGAGPSSSLKRMIKSKKIRAKPFSKNELMDMVQFLDEQGYEHTTAGHVHQKKSGVLNQLSNLLYEKYGTMHSKRQIQKRYSDLKTREQWRLASLRRKILRVTMLRSESEMLPATVIEDNADTEREH